MVEVAAESERGDGFGGTVGTVRFDEDEVLKYPVGDTVEGAVGLI
jgi:hypothetical protein